MMENSASHRLLLKAINRISSYLADGLEVKNVFDILLRDLLNLSNSSYGVIGEILSKNSDTSLVVQAIINLETDNNDQINNVDEYDFDSLFCGAIKRDEVVVSQAQCNNNLPDGCPPVESFISIPVHHAGNLVAVICMVNRVDGYNEELIKYLQPLFSFCSHLIELARQQREQHLVEKNYKQANSLMTSLVDNLQSGIIVEDDERNIIQANQLFCDMFDIETHPSDLVDTNHADVIEKYKNQFLSPDGFIESTERCIAWKEIVSSEEIDMVDSRIFERDYIPVQLEDDEQQINLVHLWSYRDITSRKRIEEAVRIQSQQLEKSAAELLKAKEEAEAATKAKSQFLATMSHEIRTPMNGVLGMTQVLSKTQLNDDQKNYLNVISESGKALLTVINDILDFSKIEAGKLALELAPFNLENTVKEVRLLLENSTKNKNLEFNLYYQSDCPKNFSGDAGRLRQILINLAGNAIKFTEKGHVLIGVRCTGGSEQQTKLRIDVQDTGIGIDEKALSKLFDSFTQADGSTARRFGGTGLGLAICKQLVELMGGEIGIDSVLGKGSTFWISLTLPVIGENIQVAQHSTAPVKENVVSNLSGKVLVVDDVNVNHIVAHAILTQAGVLIGQARNGEEAIKEWEEGDYDLILMDCQMPVIDGYQATQMIRQQEQKTGVHIPIVALTANALGSERDKCLEAGMDDFLAKPFEEQALINVLKTWLKPTAINSKLPESAKETAEALIIDEDILDEKKFNQLVELMGDDIELLINSFVKDASSKIINLKKAIEAKDIENLRKQTHALRGICGNVGAIHLMMIVDELAAHAKVNISSVKNYMEQIQAIYDKTVKCLESKVNE